MIMMNELLDRFTKAYPIPVALRALIERLLSPEKLNQWFDLNSDKHYPGNAWWFMILPWIWQQMCFLVRTVTLKNARC